MNDKKVVVKVNGNHVYERDVDFIEYFNQFIEERKDYPVMVSNILDFELHFKTITAYYILTNNNINDSDQLSHFLDSLKLRFAFLSGNYNESRIEHMNNHINMLKENIFKYADVYCFFDRMSLGDLLTVFSCLDFKLQEDIFSDLKKYHMTFNMDQVSHFIKEVFCLVSIRNCVMHGNSLTILVRFYNPKEHELRTVNDRRRYIKLIKLLSKEKTHDY